MCGCHKDETIFHCIVKGHGEYYDIDFTQSQESETEPRYCTNVGKYLYEPDAALMKGGPFHLISQWMGIEKLAHNTHLYTSERYYAHFYGRVFCVLKELKLNKKEIAATIPEGRAHVVTRNYPVEAAALQRQLGLKEGGDLFVIATTVGTQKRGFLCCLPARYEHFLKRL